MEQVEENWGDAELLSDGVDLTQEEIMEKIAKMKEAGYATERRNIKYRDTKKQVDLRKRKAKRKNSRKSRKRAA